MVDLNVEGGVARIFLNRPEKVNALDTPTLVELAKATDRVYRDQSVRVAVLGGHGRAFCGGADVKELAALTPKSARIFVERVHAVCAGLRGLLVPVVARLHGAVIGAGLEIAAACDLRVAAPGTKFSMPEVRIGIPSVVEAALLPRLMGSGRAAWMVMTGEAIDERRALEWGLIEQVGGDEAVDALIRVLLKNDREALRLQKELLQLWEEAPLATSIEKSFEYFTQAHLNR